MNKREILLRLLHVEGKPPSSFWAREFKFLNRLMKKFPDKTFWEQVSVPKVSSLLFYLSDCLYEIEDAYKLFKFKPLIQNAEYKIGRKSGSAYKSKKSTKTVKQFLGDK